LNILSFGECFLNYKMHICDICCVGTLSLGIILDCIVLFVGCNFLKSPFYYSYDAGFSLELTRI
jgi:hypothetical protein